MRVYLDHNATSPLRLEAAEAVREAHGNAWGNPSSVHAEGRRARALIDASREMLRAALGADAASEIIFVASATEANHLALAGMTAKGPDGGGRWRVLTTEVEHPSVIGAARRLEADGRVDLAIVPVDRSGRIVLEELLKLLEYEVSDHILVSVIAGNNETGVVQPIGDIAALTRRYGALLHVDATQCVGRIPVKLGNGDDTWPVDLMTVSSHKLGGPRGAGALFARRGLTLMPVLAGGHQERDRRAGTEDTAAIAGFVAAVSVAIDAQPSEAGRLAELRQRLREGIATAIDDVRFIAQDGPRLPNTLAVAFDGCSGEELLAALDLAGIAASSGSACSSGSLEPSPVLLAMGYDEDVARSVVRFSLGWTTQPHDIELVLQQLPAIVARCRNAADDWDD